MVDATALDQGQTWQSIGVYSKPGIGPSGGFEPGYQVSFRTVSGHIGDIFVPERQMNDPALLDKVRAMIDAKANQLEAIGSLKG